MRWWDPCVILTLPYVFDKYEYFYQPNVNRSKYVASLVNTVKDGGSVGIKPMGEDAATQVKADFEQLVLQGVLNGDAQIVLVGHSMGGGLVARAVATQFSDTPDSEWVRNRTIGIITLGTPHKGSAYAGYMYKLYRPGILPDVLFNHTVEGDIYINWILDRYVDFCCGDIRAEARDEMLQINPYDIFDVTTDAFNELRIETLSGIFEDGTGSNTGTLNPVLMTYYNQ